MQTTVPPSLLWRFILTTACILAVRSWVLLRLADSPFFEQNHGDSAYYLGWAARVAAGQWTDGQAFLGLPLYPYALALLQWAQCPFPWTPLALQALTDALTGGLLSAGVVATAARPAARSTQVAAALVAAGWAFFTPAQSFAATLMPNPPATLVFTAGLIYCLAARRRAGPPGIASCAALGLGLGFACLLSANLLFLFPLLAFLAWAPAEPRALARTTGRVVAVAAGVVLGASPAWCHNYFIAGEPVALSAHGGINFYIGNNPRATGYPNFPPGMRASQAGMLEDSARLAEARVGRPLRRFEVSAFWNAEARKFISESPAAWVRVMFAKIRNYYSFYEYDDISVIRPLRMLGVTTPGWTFGWLVPLAGVGLVLGWRNPATRWSAAAVVLHTLSVLPAFVTERYRLMAAPALLLVAATGGLAAWQERTTLSWRQGLAGGLAALGGVWLAVSAPRPGGLDTLADYNAAVRLLAAGRRDLALPLVERVEGSGAANAEVALMLGNFWQEAGESARALGYYRQAIERDPGEIRAWNNAAVLAIRSQNWPLAERLVAHLQRTASSDSRVAFYAAQIALARNDLAAARQALDRALAQRPGEQLYLELAKELSRRENSPQR